MSDHDLEVWKAQALSNLEEFKAGLLVRVEAFRASADAAKQALSVCILVNGGAAAALLALLGSLAGKPLPSPGMMMNIAPASLAAALAAFALGVLLGAVATGVAFLSANAAQQWAESEDNSAEKIKWRRAHARWSSFAKALVALSYLAFAVGAGIAYLSFR